MPAYKVDWSDFEKHKAAGGLFNTYKKKEQIPFGVDAIISHRLFLISGILALEEHLVEFNEEINHEKLLFNTK